jgi:hypothetical protein
MSLLLTTWRIGCTFLGGAFCPAGTEMRLQGPWGGSVFFPSPFRRRAAMKVIHCCLPVLVSLTSYKIVKRHVWWDWADEYGVELYANRRLADFLTFVVYWKIKTIATYFIFAPPFITILSVCMLNAKNCWSHNDTLRNNLMQPNIAIVRHDNQFKLSWTIICWRHSYRLLGRRLRHRLSLMGRDSMRQVTRTAGLSFQPVNNNKRQIILTNSFDGTEKLYAKEHCMHYH